MPALRDDSKTPDGGTRVHMGEIKPGTLGMTSTRDGLDPELKRKNGNESLRRTSRDGTHSLC